MGEAGGPAIAEMPQLNAVDRVRGKLQKWFKETFTIEGRANAMAQKQMDAIVASQPEELRAKAMELLESKRPDFVAANLPGAKNALVRNAAIGAATGTLVVGGLTGLVIWQQDRVAGALYDMAGGVDRAGNGLSKVGKRIGKSVEGLKRAIGLWPFNKLNVTFDGVPSPKVKSGP